MSVAAGIDRNPTIAKILSEYFPTNKDRANARVLDLAAGTGLVGKDLHKIGFTNMDAVGKCNYYTRSVYLNPKRMCIKKSTLYLTTHISDRF